MERLERQSERQEQASPNISIQSSSSEGTTDDSFDPGRQPKGPYSLLKIPRYSMELIRGDVSSNLGACLANAFLLDLKHMGLLHPKLNLKDIILDKSKIDREKARIKLSSHVKHVHQNENLVCVGIDCRVDKDTLQYKEVVDENGEKQRIRAPLNFHQRNRNREQISYP